MRAWKKIFVILAVVVAGAAAWLAFAWYVPYRNFPADGAFVEIPRGTPHRGVARLLAEKGVVRSALAFELLARWRAGVTVQAGEYFFDRALSSAEVFRKLAEGRVYFHTLVIPEGFNIFDVAQRVQQVGLASREEFLAAARDAALIRDLAPAATTLEGFLFPATYSFSRSVTARQIAATMVARFREVWAVLPEPGRNPRGLSVLEAVTLASLVERETSLGDERPLIAGVFYNRLRKRIALQCDPTVVYAMQLAGRNDGIIHQSDLRIASPYNTYRHRGLPPGPIANPGEAALRAVLYPPQVDYLYFVSDTQGGHFFSRTLAEHNARVAEYRRLTGQPPAADNHSNTAKRSSPPAKSALPRRNR